MPSISTVAMIVVLVIPPLAAAALWPSIFAFIFRDFLRSWPEARTSFIGNRAWIAFSRRFGLAYVFPLLIGPFIWVLVGMKFVPNTLAGAWFLFGPAIASLTLGIVLGALWILRWMVDER